jgi:hypothetical protein
VKTLIEEVMAVYPKVGAHVVAVNADGAEGERVQVLAKLPKTPDSTDLKAIRERYERQCPGCRIEIYSA